MDPLVAHDNRNCPLLPSCQRAVLESILAQKTDIRCSSEPHLVLGYCALTNTTSDAQCESVPVFSYKRPVIQAVGSPFLNDSSSFFTAARHPGLPRGPLRRLLRPHRERQDSHRRGGRRGGVGTGQAHPVHDPAEGAVQPEAARLPGEVWGGERGAGHGGRVREPGSADSCDDDGDFAEHAVLERGGARGVRQQVRLFVFRV